MRSRKKYYHKANSETKEQNLCLREGMKRNSSEADWKLTTTKIK